MIQDTAHISMLLMLSLIEHTAKWKTYSYKLFSVPLCYPKASYASMGDGFYWTEFKTCTYFCLSKRMLRFVLCFSPKLPFILKQTSGF